MKWKWIGGIFLIAGILWASLRVGDWMGERVVQQARLEPAKYVVVSETSHHIPLSPITPVRRVRITRAPARPVPTFRPVVRPTVPAPMPPIPTQPPPAKDAGRVRALYNGWKKAHAGSVSQLMRYYAPGARIVREGGVVQNYGHLKQLAAQVRANKTFNSVRDLAPLKMGGTRRKIWMRARHRYAHSNRNHQPLAGSRQLAWQKIKGRWLIVEDFFPQSYAVVK